MYFEKIKKVWRSINTAGEDFRAVLILRGSFFDFDFWREFEFIFEILVGHESGPGGCNMSEKTGGRKSHVRVPLRTEIFSKKIMEKLTVG